MLRLDQSYLSDRDAEILAKHCQQRESPLYALIVHSPHMNVVIAKALSDLRYLSHVRRRHHLRSIIHRRNRQA